MGLQEHPTVKSLQLKPVQDALTASPSLDADWLKEICLAAGADDVGFVEVKRPELAEELTMIRKVAPWTRTLISFVCRMNRESIRTPARSIANLEFHEINDKVNSVAHKVIRELELRGIRAINPSVGFPMETDNYPERMWVVSHKLVAIAAGMGQMGIHRNIIHPKFGNFILLGTILTDMEIREQSAPVDFNPCLTCKLCVSACPVGAIKADGQFNFAACYTHNYREFMGGFNSWVEGIVESKSAVAYRRKVKDSENVSMWQSLSFGANYKAAYCLAVCPAGEDVIAPFLENRSQFIKDTVRPLQQKVEPVYVVPNSDAETHLSKRFPHKESRKVNNFLRPVSIPTFLHGLALVFQHEKSAGVNAIYHFRFTGQERKDATVVIRQKSLEVLDGHHGKANLTVTADSDIWIRFLRKETNLLWALIRGKIQLRGNPKLLLTFAKCFLA